MLPTKGDYRMNEATLSTANSEDSLTCTCGRPGTFWGYCDACELDRWVTHHCPFPCDDVTCENGALCLSCVTGSLCPVHDDEEYAHDLHG